MTQIFPLASLSGQSLCREEKTSKPKSTLKTNTNKQTNKNLTVFLVCVVNFEKYDLNYNVLGNTLHSAVSLKTSEN